MSDNEQVQAVQIVREQQSEVMSLKQIGDRVNLVHQVLEKVMKKGTHFGTVPGCGTKMVLLKPGADVLAMTFRLVPQFKVDRTDGDNGHREYDVTCSMFSAGGELLGQGVGSASTMEKKYRYRNGQENPDIADVYNSVLKIAKKRAHIDATLTVTGAADLFTQDLIDDDEPQRAPIAPPRARTPTTTPTPPPATPATPPATGDTASNTLTGVIEQVSEKPDKNKKIKYGVKLANDARWFGTYSTTMGKDATYYRSEGIEVVLTVEASGNFWKLTAIEPAHTANAAPTSPEAEELPFE